MWEVLKCFRCKHLEIPVVKCLYKSTIVDPEQEEECANFYSYRKPEEQARH